MKTFLRKISIFFLLILILSLSVFAQTPRKYIVEEGTNASCGPCASQNPRFKIWLESRKDVVIPVIYHA